MLASNADVLAGKIGAPSASSGDAGKALESFSAAASFKCFGCTPLHDALNRRSMVSLDSHLLNDYKDDFPQSPAKRVSVGDFGWVSRSTRQEDRLQ